MELPNIVDLIPRQPPKTVDKKKHLVSIRPGEPSQIKATVPNSVSRLEIRYSAKGAQNTSDPGLLSVIHKKESVLSVVSDTASEVGGGAKNSGGLDGNEQCISVVASENVMASQSNRIRGPVNDSKRNESVLKTKRKGQGQCPSSSDNNEDDDDGDNDNDDINDSDMSSAEESSEELDSSSSSNSSDDSDAEGKGGLEAIAEEQSLRIDMSDISGSGSKRNRLRKEKVIEHVDVEAEDDGNC